MKFTFIIVLIMDKRDICCYCICFTACLCLFPEWNIDYIKKRNCNSFWLCCLRKLQFSIFVSKLPQIQDALVAEEPLHGDVIRKDSAELPVRNRVRFFGDVTCTSLIYMIKPPQSVNVQTPFSFYAPVRPNFHGLDCDRLSEFRSLCSTRAQRPPVLRPH